MSYSVKILQKMGVVKMKEVMYNDYVKELLDSISKGAFLSVSAEGQDNTMTIGWGSIGYMWKKPVFIVMVRYSRHTYEMLEKSEYFTVSVPLYADLKKALGVCGSLSGAGHDKWVEAGITKVRAHKVDAPLVEECDLHYECKLIGKTPLMEGMLDVPMQEQFYGKGDYHLLYYGEIVGTYVK